MGYMLMDDVPTYDVYEEYWWICWSDFKRRDFPCKSANGNTSRAALGASVPDCSCSKGMWTSEKGFEDWSYCFPQHISGFPSTFCHFLVVYEPTHVVPAGVWTSSTPGVLMEIRKLGTRGVGASAWKALFSSTNILPSSQSRGDNLWEAHFPLLSSGSSHVIQYLGLEGVRDTSVIRTFLLDMNLIVRLNYIVLSN